jgi:hypothetical protein
LHRHPNLHDTEAGIETAQLNSSYSPSESLVSSSSLHRFLKIDSLKQDCRFSQYGFLSKCRLSVNFAGHEETLRISMGTHLPLIIYEKKKENGTNKRIDFSSWKRHLFSADDSCYQFP